MTLTFGSLFAGVGGFDLGLERAGMQCSWQVEIDDFCTRILEKHWPYVTRFRDTRECGKHNLERVDLIAGGFPCLSSSIAGSRKGNKDEGWLWTEFARIICEIKPRWVLVENVPGLLSVNDGGAFGEILRDLAQLGYDAEWGCLPAYLFGPAQSRIRVFLVAHLSQCDSQCDKKTETILGWWKWHEAQIGPFSWRRGTEGNVQIVEPGVGRVADGVPSQLDRNRVLGNAIPPAMVEWLGRRIMEVEEGE